ncbi:MAG: protein kinase [Planctomycetaceae bacterium]
MTEVHPIQLDAILDRQRAAWELNQSPTPESFLQETPFADSHDALLDLIYNEILIREEMGEEVQFANYLERYPHLADELNLHFEIHHAIRLQLLLDAADEEAPAESGELESIFPDDAYESIHVLGQGAMATVYKARHRELNRCVALKLFEHGRRLSSREAFRVRMEAEAMARVSHPNIVKIFEIGQRNSVPFLALELAEGGTLAKRLQEYRYSPRAAAELVETLARAIHHAHECEIIHRDLKPANVLFTATGRPMITDFGLAKVQQDRVIASSDATQSGESIGTPRYMAPEQAAGKLDHICPATDVHALGAILYECLTGRAPFVASSVLETLQLICHEDPVPPSRIQPGIPRDLETICLQCLNKHSGLRYRSAADLAEDLRRFLNEEPITARPTPLWERAAKWCRRKPAQATLLIGSTALLLVVVMSLFLMSMARKSAIARQRTHIAQLVHDGQTAMENNDTATAMQHFEAAWLIVQSDREFADHETSVSGWLEHCRNLETRNEWPDRLPPPTLDVRRDNALFESLLLVRHSDNPVQTGIDSITSAREFVPANDRRWQSDLTLLAVQKAELTEISSGPEAALAALDDAGPINARLFHTKRANLLASLERDSESQAALRLAKTFPANAVIENLQAGMDAARSDDLNVAVDKFQQVLNEQPDHFAARLFQSACYLKLNRPSEARIGLTACIAQRPDFQWSYYLRAEAELKLDDKFAARRDLERASQSRTENLISERAFALLKSIDTKTPVPSTQE